MKRCLAVSMLAVVALSGCTKESMRSTPVTVQTPEGPVICQLYTRELLWWDEATSYPPSLTQEAANQACKEEGQRLQSAAE